jgi:hypothetical protein
MNNVLEYSNKLKAIKLAEKNAYDNDSRAISEIMTASVLARINYVITAEDSSDVNPTHMEFRVLNLRTNNVKTADFYTYPLLLRIKSLMNKQMKPYGFKIKNICSPKTNMGSAAVGVTFGPISTLKTQWKTALKEMYYHVTGQWNKIG